MEMLAQNMGHVNGKNGRMGKNRGKVSGKGGQQSLEIRMPGKHVNTAAGRGIHAMKKETFWAEYVRASANGKEIGYPELVQLKKNENDWQLKLANNCGVELPSTDGPGTEYFLIIGLVMALGAAAALSRRMRLNDYR